MDYLKLKSNMLEASLKVRSKTCNDQDGKIKKCFQYSVYFTISLIAMVAKLVIFFFLMSFDQGSPNVDYYLICDVATTKML